MGLTAAERWAQARNFHHSEFSAERLAAERTASVAACLPARECASTIGPIVSALMGLREAGLIDEVVVVDAASADGTARVASEAGAVVWQEGELQPQFGPVLGKGDAMWRALSVLDAEVVCFLDADTAGFQAHFAVGLLGPLLCDPEVSFVKASYRRPFSQGEVLLPEGGGRVSQLMARPALTLFYPELAAVGQPLAGEIAARRALLERLSFTTGYGVETAMLIDVWKAVGLDGIAQVDLDERRNSHQSLAALSRMAYAVLAVIARRLEAEGRLSGVELLDLPGLVGAQGIERLELVERPPLARTRMPARSS